MRSLNQLANFTLVLSCGFFCGCMDDAALAQREASKKLKDTIVASEKAMAEVSAIDPAANRASAEKLRQIASSATPTSGSMASQKAAMALIASQLQVQAARLDAVAIEQIERAQRTDADNTLLFASLSSQFQLLAKSSVVEAPPEARELLQKDRETSEMTVTVLSSQSEKLKGVVDAAASSIVAQESSALALEKTAGQLKQQAAAAGPVAGFPMTVESQKALSESRKLRSQAAIQDLDTQQAALEQRIAEKIGDAFQDSLKRNKAGLEAIEKIEGVREATVKDLGRIAGEYRDSALAAAKATRDASAKAMALYDGAIEGLEKAVSLAQQASGGGGEMAKSAKSSLVAAQLALAAMAERRAVANTLEIAAFNAASKMDPDGTWTKDAASAQSTRSAAVTKATEAFETALGGIPEGSGEDNASKFRKGIELAKANISGNKAPPSNPPADATSDANSSRPVDEPVKDGTGLTPDAPANAPAPDAPMADPAVAPTTDPASDPATTPTSDPATTPPADPATDPGTTPTSDPATTPPTDPASDPATTPPSEPPANPPADPPASFM